VDAPDDHDHGRLRYRAADYLSMEAVTPPSTLSASIVELIQNKVIVPNDPCIIAALLRMPGSSTDIAELKRVVPALVAAGLVRIVTIGTEGHLAIAVPGVANGHTSVPAVHERNETDSKLEIALDAEAERLVLYRVALVFLVVAGLLLLRQIGLAML